ncbi:MAG TPA: YciI family protein [Polyangiaceae bacterium]|nr:YciI family protein [Polyangiaceae bacterium]
MQAKKEDDPSRLEKREKKARLRSLQILCQAGSMFVIELIYKAELSEIDAHMKAHVAFLDKYYAAGNFLVSGRKIPRDGGIILAVGKDKQQLEAIVKEDPFHEHGLAEFRIIEFRASQRADDIQRRIDG